MLIDSYNYVSVAEEQNVSPIIGDSNVYYVTIRDIEPEEELLSKLKSEFVNNTFYYFRNFQ